MAGDNADQGDWHQSDVMKTTIKRVLWCACVCGMMTLMLSACARDNGVEQVSEITSMREEKRSAPIVYVALGDSTGAGVGARDGRGYVARLFERIERERPNSRVMNVCVSGAETADVLSRQLPRIDGASAALITLGIGINDIGHGVKIEQFARNYEEIIRRLREKTNAPIVVANIPDISLAPRVPTALHDAINRQIQLFNNRIDEIARRHNLQVVDAYQMSREVVPARTDFFSEDGFHPSAAGYEHWAESMWPTVRAALK